MFYDDPVNVKVGDNVRKARRTQGLSMKELGALVGLSSQQIYKYEVGEDRISVSMLHKVARVLHAPIGDFFAGLATGEPLSGNAATHASEDRATRRSLSRIRSPDVRGSLCALIFALSYKVEGASDAKTSNAETLNESAVISKDAEPLTELIQSHGESVELQPDPIDAHLGQRVVELRKRLGVSQLAAARKIGISPQQLRKYETAQNRISAVVLYQIATSFEQEVGFFYEGLAQVETRSATTKANWSTVRLAETLESIQDPETRKAVLNLIHLTT